MLDKLDKLMVLASEFRTTTSKYSGFTICEQFTSILPVKFTDLSKIY